MNIIQNIVNMYKINPIKFLLIIAVIYLLLKQSNIIEDFILTNVDGDVNLSTLSVTSQLAQKWKKAFSIDNNGNITFKKNVSFLPPGSIVAWNQATAPTGWALCDGQNGTPDLRGRFIRMQNNHGGDQANPMKYQEHNIVTADRNRIMIGVSRNINKTWMSEHALNDKGGTDVMVMTLEDMPAHKHTNPRSIGKWNRSFRGEGGDPPILTAPGSESYEWVHYTKNTGGSNGHNNIPPYYVLSYIMKL